MRVVNFSEARKNLKAVLDQTSEDANVTVITRRNAEDMVIMSLETYNAYQETFHLLRSPENAKHLAKSIEQFRQGKIKERDVIDE